MVVTYQLNVALIQLNVAGYFCKMALIEHTFAEYRINRKMLNSKSLGNKITAARKKINLSQAELAQQVSISSQAVGKWERGESMPDIKTLNRLAEIFQVDLNYFSDNFQSSEIAASTNISRDQQVNTGTDSMPTKKFELNWDMSQGNWVDADFSVI
jgi:transcriptional regulator with XRE-family HTH domain